MEITKKSDDGKLLSGVTFGIFTKDGKKVAEIITNDKGIALAENLIYGDYYLQELKTIDGYKLNEKKFHFTIHENKEVIKVEVINDKIREIKKTDSPKTGDTSNVMGLLVLLETSGVGLAGTYFLKKRRAKKS